jgi:hypothetical protein
MFKGDPRERGFHGMDGVAAFLEVEEAVHVAVEASGDGRFLAIEVVEESGVAGVGSNAAVRKAAGSGTEESSGAGPIWLGRAAGFDGPGPLLLPF